MRHFFSLFVLTSVIGCSTGIKNDIPSDQKSNKEHFKLSDINIARDWVEVEKINGDWYFVSEDGVTGRGCSVRFYENQEKRPVCMVTCGGNGQWHGINKVIQTSDSIQFFVYYPPDSSEMTITMTYQDRAKKIVSWNIDGFSKNYIDERDTAYFKKNGQYTRDNKVQSDTSQLLETIEEKTGANNQLAPPQTRGPLLVSAACIK